MTTFWLGLSLIVGAAAADPTCPADGGWLDGHAHLRAMFLDLRGEVPAPEDYATLLDEEGEVPPGVVDQLLEGRAFLGRAVRFHQTLFFNDVSQVRLLPANSLFAVRNGVYFVPSRADSYRGQANRYCGNAPTRFDEDGQPIPLRNADGSVSEGYVTVRPYWAPDTEIQVCAYDAQEAEFSSSGTDCSTTRGFVDPGCGCGPSLQWCGVGFQETVLMDSFARDLDKRVERMVDGDQPWLALLTGTKGFVNGPMVDFYRHRTQLPQGIHFQEAAVDVRGLPDLAWTDDGTWVEVDLGPEHSGVLTSPAYLMRFQTGRARANQYHQSFLCEPFQAPESGLGALDDPDPTLDLSRRDGCKYCHALLEPAAAHWGRWTQFGAGYLDPEDFPVYDETCKQCAAGVVDCPDVCDDYYIVRTLAAEQEPYVGYLTSLEFLDERYHVHLEQGPRRMVNQHDVDGRLPRCTAQKTAQWLLGRELTASDEAWVQELATEFVTHDYSWRRLVRDIVLSDAYRSVE